MALQMGAMCWRDDDRLNPTDVAILEQLEKGRETRGSLVENIKKHETTVSGRLNWLRDHFEYVRYYHEPTGLYELTEKAREDQSE